MNPVATVIETGSTMTEGYRSSGERGGTIVHLLHPRRSTRRCRVSLSWIKGGVTCGPGRDTAGGLRPSSVARTGSGRR